MDPLSPIQPEEMILRRVPKHRMSLDQRTVQPDAFAPKMPDKKNTGDTDGLSVYREAFHSAEDVGRTLRSRGSEPMWVARLRASDITALGLTLLPDPKDGFAHPKGLPQPGHALIPEIAVSTATTDRVVEIKRMLAALVTPTNLFGPFDPPPPEPKVP